MGDAHFTLTSTDLLTFDRQSVYAECCLQDVCERGGGL